MADRIVQCTSPFSVQSVNGPVSVGVGDLYFADDPILKGRESHFADVRVKSSTGGSARTPTGSVEEATANPGIRRRLSRTKSETKDEEPSPDTKPEESEV